MAAVIAQTGPVTANGITLYHANLNGVPAFNVLVKDLGTGGYGQLEYSEDNSTWRLHKNLSSKGRFSFVVPFKFVRIVSAGITAGVMDIDVEFSGAPQGQVQTESAGYAALVHPGFVPGRFYTSTAMANSASGAAMTANTIRFHLAYVPAPVTISELGVRISTGIAGSFQCAVYNMDPATGKPGQLVTYTPTSGSTATAATIMLALGQPVRLEPGWYYFAVNVTAGVTCSAAGATQAYSNLIGTNPLSSNLGLGITGYGFGQTFGTWPDLLNVAATETTSTSANPMVIFKAVA